MKNIGDGGDIEGLNGFRIPRMMDGSISLSYLRRAYPSATGLCIHTSGHEFTMLPVLGDLIQIPEEDESKRYYVLPYQSKDWIRWMKTEKPGIICEFVFMKIKRRVVVLFVPIHFTKKTFQSFDIVYTFP